MNTFKSKLVKYLKDEIKDFKTYADGMVKDMSIDTLTRVLEKINSDEFDCEAVGSEWQPEYGECYHYPRYAGRWKLGFSKNNLMASDNIIKIASEAFKTESECKQYMDAKGWYNNKKWELT